MKITVEQMKAIGMSDQQIAALEAVATKSAPVKTGLKTLHCVDGTGIIVLPGGVELRVDAYTPNNRLSPAQALDIAFHWQAKYAIAASLAGGEEEIFAEEAARKAARKAAKGGAAATVAI